MSGARLAPWQLEGTSFLTGVLVTLTIRDLASLPVLWRWSLLAVLGLFLVVTRLAIQLRSRAGAQAESEPNGEMPATEIPKSSFAAETGEGTDKAARFPERQLLAPQSPQPVALPPMCDSAPTEVEAPSLDGPSVDAPTPEFRSASADRLADVWETYLREGDGRFTAVGLQSQLDAAGVSGRVVPGVALGTGELTLAVDFGDGSGRLYLLPHINATLRALDDWFHATNSGGSRLARISRLIEPAVVCRSAGGGNLLKKGLVE